MPQSGIEILASYNITDLNNLQHNASILSCESIESFIEHNRESSKLLQSQKMSNNPLLTLSSQVTNDPSSVTRVSSLVDSSITEDISKVCHPNATPSPQPAENFTSPTESAGPPGRVIPIMQEASSNVTSILDPTTAKSSIPENNNICNKTISDLSDPKISAAGTPKLDLAQEKITVSDVVQKISGDATVSANNDCILVTTIMTPLSEEKTRILENIKIEGQERSPLKSITNDESVPKGVTSAFQNILKWPGDDFLEKRQKTQETFKKTRIALGLDEQVMD